MKRKFLKVLIVVSLTFGILLSGNIFTNQKFISNKTVNCMTILNETENLKDDYCFSISKEIKIIDINLNNSEYRLRNQIIDEIVIHHSASENTTVEDIDRMHNNNGWGGIGYNFYIRTDGTVYKGRDVKFAGAHCIGKNDNSIGICLEGNFDNHKPSNEQMESLLSLTKKLSNDYDIKKISSHKDNYATNCPGKYFPWDLFINVYYNTVNNN